MSDYVCSDCHQEQDSMRRICDHCGSSRVVLVSVVKDVLYRKWQDEPDPEGRDETPQGGE